MLERRPGRSAEGRRAWTTTTTTSTPRPEFYGDIITTRDYQDRLDTLARVRDAGIKVCCGGIVGMGESRAQRAGLIAQLANLDPYPESVPINNLVQVRRHAAVRHRRRSIRSSSCAPSRWRASRCRGRRVRLSAGRQQMGDAVQALCFLAGANSIFYGDKLLTTGNPDTQADLDLLDRLGLKPGQPEPDRRNMNESPVLARKPLTLHRLREMHAAGEKIAMLTCYDASFARAARRGRRRLPAGGRFARHGAAGPDQHGAGDARADGLSHRVRGARQPHGLDRSATCRSAATRSRANRRCDSAAR